MGNRSRFRKPHGAGTPSQKSKTSPYNPGQLKSSDEHKRTETHVPEGILMADYTPFLLFIYVILPTIAIGGLILYYFYLTNEFIVFAFVAAWVIIRGLPTVTKRWLGKPIPTSKPAAHVMRLYFMLVITLVPYLLIFSTLYYSISHKYAGQCTNVALTKMSSLYFATTIFTTTGFGDIHAVTTTCQALVTAQMVSGFVVISILIALFVSRLLQVIGKNSP